MLSSDRHQSREESFKHYAAISHGTSTSSSSPFADFCTHELLSFYYKILQNQSLIVCVVVSYFLRKGHENLWLRSNPLLQAVTQVLLPPLSYCDGAGTFPNSSGGHGYGSHHPGWNYRGALFGPPYTAEPPKKVVHDETSTTSRRRNQLLPFRSGRKDGMVQQRSQAAHGSIFWCAGSMMHSLGKIRWPNRRCDTFLFR